MVVATLVAIVASLAADAVLVKIGVSVFPKTKGYSHFQFSDYSKLTIIGVVIACVGWPIVARISSQPKWLFLRAAVAVTLVLFLPDARDLVPRPIGVGGLRVDLDARRDRGGHLPVADPAGAGARSPRATLSASRARRGSRESRAWRPRRRWSSPRTRLTCR